MDIVSFQMDLLRLGSAVAEQEQISSPTLPALEESLAALASIESTQPLVVESGSGR